MKKCQGFTLIELILFIIITSLLASTILLVMNTVLQKVPAMQNQIIAEQTAQKCMGWFVGQRKLVGYSTLTCPNTTTPSFCTAPSGYTISTNVSCTTLSGDTNYKSITVTISGLGDAVLTTLIASY